MLSHSKTLLRLLLGSPNIHSLKVPSANLARLAVDTGINGVSGVYFEGQDQRLSSETSGDKDERGRVMGGNNDAQHGKPA